MTNDELRQMLDNHYVKRVANNPYILTSDTYNRSVRSMIALYAHTTIGKIVSFGAMCVCMIVYIVLYLKCYLLETAYVREVVYSLGSFYVAYWHYQFYNFGHGLAKVGMIVAVVMSLGIVALTILDLVVDNARNQDWADRVFFVCATVILSCTVIAVHVAYRIRHKLRQRELPRLQ